MTEPVQKPHLTVVRGQPSPEQLAALVAVLATRGGAAAAA
ncbi:MAG: Acyl-CoA carboxylase epsilon subunit, partial [Frankiales bacterium]|nr:Acyl-CoA carboxylase epsilon subunit [Frankiales bacterium]